MARPGELGGPAAVTPQAPQAPPPPAAAPAAPPAAASPYDFGGDPILQRIVAYDTQARASAQAAADASRRQLAIQFGDAAGITGDSATAEAAAANPFSVLANLKRGYGDTARQHDEQLNDNNLFYSGARVNQLQQDATGYQQQQYDARQQALASLGGIQNQLAQQLSGADQADIQGQNDAYGRAQQQAVQYGYDPGATTTPAAAPHPATSVVHALAATVPRAVKVTANPTGASWRPNGGIFSIH